MHEKSEHDSSCRENACKHSNIQPRSTKLAQTGVWADGGGFYEVLKNCSSSVSHCGLRPQLFPLFHTNTHESFTSVPINKPFTATDFSSWKIRANRLLFAIFLIIYLLLGLGCELAPNTCFLFVCLYFFHRKQSQSFTIFTMNSSK